MSRKSMVASACLLLTGAAVVFAAQNTEPETNRAKPAQESTRAADSAADQGQAHKSPDHFLATCIAVGNQEEIAISKFAREKSEHPEVQKFADKMVAEHHEFLMKLQKYAPEASKAEYLEAETKTAGKQADRVEGKAEIRQTAAESDGEKAGEAQTADAKRAHHGLNPMQIERELATECLKAAKQKLSEKNGVEFDQCYIGMQLAMHQAMHSKLKVFQRHTSSELASILAEGQKTTEQHMAMAEELMKSLDDKDKSSTQTTTVEKNRDGAKRDKQVTKEKTVEKEKE